MKEKRRRVKKQRYYDYNLFFLTVFLVMVGLIMIYSATQGAGDFFSKQAVFAVLGLGGMIITSLIPYQIYKKLAVPTYIISMLLILLVLTPLGVESHNARRWINIGFGTLQPAEVAKIALIFVVALIICKIDQKKFATGKSLACLAAVTGVLFFEVFVFTDNLSSAIILLGITFVMYFVAHPNYKGFAKLCGFGLAGVIVLVLAIDRLASESSNFRFGRVLAWLHPEDYVGNLSYQQMNGLYAIGSGGLFGKGLGSSAQKVIIPEVQNDMIFSVICEELGLFGAFVVILIFILLLYQIVHVALHVKDLFGSMLAIGVFAHIAIQVVLNIAVVTNSIPNTGVSLPFISAGGTSLLFLMAEIGIVLNVSRSIEYES